MKKISLSCVVITLLQAPAQAQQAQILPEPPQLEPNDPLELPPLDPAPARNSETSLGRQKVEEFRINDRVVLMKITPDWGPSYYLDDPAEDYDGLNPQGGIGEIPKMRYWKLGEW